MKKVLNAQDALDQYLDCMGEFNIENPVCRQFCALRLRCAVDYGQKEKVELLEELFDGGDLVLQTH